jgi:hypothetical protein
MKHYNFTDILLAAATAAVFLFLFALTVPRPQLVGPMSEVAQVSLEHVPVEFTHSRRA